MKLEDDMTDKKSPPQTFWDEILGWAISGVFVLGCYAIARYILKAGDMTIEFFAICLLWGSLAGAINKQDGDA